MITAPYNFVPLNNKVVTPWWAKHISHDIPFENAQSGTLELTITAKSPIYVRNSGKDTLSFNNDPKGYFIPGSSIKGMIRNVLEIMSFGKMTNKVDDKRYSVRDFQNDKIYNPGEISKEVCCGWLQKVNGEYLITDCGKPGRIAHKELDGLCQEEKISEYYKNAANILTDKDKSAKSKCHKFPFKGIHRFTFSHNDVMRPIYKLDPAGKKKGVIVLTGQPSVRREPEGQKASGKHLEFIFFESKNKQEKVDESVIRNFFFAYHDHDKNQQKDDWKWRSQQLKKGEKIPVFFRRTEDGKGIKDMGLSYLYKITYNYSVLESISNYQGDVSNPDLSECVFGYTNGLESLKSRVHVSHAFQNSQVKDLDTISAVLAQPKASYYPTYIDQGENETVQRYKTFMDKNATISGWKRYPVRNGEVVPNPVPNNNESILTHFRPLPIESTFKCTISYHNLRLEELGALVSAITFHNTEGVFHSLGMAKPLGYGKVSVSIDNFNEGMIEAMRIFECFMNYSLDSEWWKEPQIVNLLTMARGSTSEEVDQKLKYMPLNNFVAAKGRTNADPKYALRRFNIICGSDVFPKSLLQKEDLEAYKSKVDRHKFEGLKSLEEIKIDAISSAKKSLVTALKERKGELLDELNKRRAHLRMKKKEELDRLDKAAREEKKAQKANELLSKGLDLSQLDFGKNSKSVELTLSKAVESYVLKINGVNNLSKVQPPYLRKPEDIETVVDAILKLWEKLPKNERDDSKMKLRFDRYTKWIGSESVESLRQKVKK
jgi:CRISPR-associated protein (TIGR03986 family)